MCVCLCVYVCVYIYTCNALHPSPTFPHTHTYGCILMKFRYEIAWFPSKHPLNVLHPNKKGAPADPIHKGESDTVRVREGGVGAGRMCPKKCVLCKENVFSIDWCRSGMHVPEEGLGSSCMILCDKNTNQGNMKLNPNRLTRN